MCSYLTGMLYAHYTSSFSIAPSLGAVYGVFIAHRNVICTLHFILFHCSLIGGSVRCVHSSQECYMHITLHPFPLLPHWGQCTVCSYLTGMLYAHYTSSFSIAPSLGAVYGVFIAHRNVICTLHFSLFHCSLIRGSVQYVYSSWECYMHITLHPFPLLPHWGQCTVCS